MPIGQLIYFRAEGKVKTNYRQRKFSKYTKKTNQPIESMMWKNTF